MCLCGCGGCQRWGTAHIFDGCSFTLLFAAFLLSFVSVWGCLRVGVLASVNIVSDCCAPSIFDSSCLPKRKRKPQTPPLIPLFFFFLTFIFLLFAFFCLIPSFSLTHFPLLFSFPEFLQIHHLLHLSLL